MGAGQKGARDRVGVSRLPIYKPPKRDKSNAVFHIFVLDKRNQLNYNASMNKYTHLTKKEKEFLKLVCQDIRYTDIAAKMDRSPRTIDRYRDNLLEKLKVRSRIGLVLWSIKSGLVKIKGISV